MAADPALMEKLVALCKRRGFIYPGSEIYGGLGGFWDYGPLGVELKRHIKDLWWRDMVLNPPLGPNGKEITMLGVDAALIMNPRVWEASGHVAGFADPMVDCRECKKRFRADQVWVVGFYAESERERSEWGSAELAEASPVPEKTMRVRHAISKPPLFTYAVEAAKPEEACEAACGALPRDLRKRLAPGYTAANCKAYCLLEVPENWEKRCPACQAEALTEPRAFNLMFQTYVGALQDASAVAYLRPETAQGIFVNFRNVLDTQRVKLPFGIAQVGKAFRNEINPRNYTFRSREFEQMEIEFFCRDEEALEWYAFWRQVRYEWYVRLGLKSEKLRLREQGADELAHYSKCCADIEYLFPFSDEFQELEGVAHRGCYDLEQHQKHSGRDLTYFDDERWQQDAHKFKDDKQAARKAKEGPPYRFLPTVIEPSAGVDRTALAFLCEAYTEDQAPNDKGQMEKRVVMKFHPRLAPIKAAFFPLVNRESMPDIAYAMYRDAKRYWNVFYDDRGAIGRRYRRQDEAGTPFCITVDGQTLSDGTVTIRDRDTLAQIRVHRDRVIDWLREHLE